MNMRRWGTAIVALALLSAGGTVLAVEHGPGSASLVPTAPKATGVGYSSAPVQLAHPASSPAVVATPTPAASPKPKPKAKVVTTPKATHSAAPVPEHSSAPTPVAPKPKPVVTPKPTPVATPRPTPTPSPSGPITSGTLPPLTFTIDANGVTTTVAGDSITKTYTCPTADTNCISGVSFSTPTWGQYYLKLSFQFAFKKYVGGPDVWWTNQYTGQISGSGAHSGTGGPIGYSGNFYQITLSVQVTWA